MSLEQASWDATIRLFAGVALIALGVELGGPMLGSGLLGGALGLLVLCSTLLYGLNQIAKGLWIVVSDAAGASTRSG
ncbi:hypothetical protein [Halegenticoccus soli]|uniref:hypothetical protein n=1 Tax=Halegenticoccus soli TaxID=1985678 RepID=UPI000C6E5965|nr:hypothetical protein [Halegenticoccus soli]